MTITRKIEIYVCEPDKELKKEYIHKLYEWRDGIRQAANLIVTHKFAQQTVRDFMYFQPDVMERFALEHPDKVSVSKKTGKQTIKYNVSDTLVNEKGLSEQNTTYRLISNLLKGKVPSDMYGCLNQAVSKTFKETVKDINRGEATIRSYKNSIPMPFSADSISNIHKAEDNRYYFTLFGIPFCCLLGQDNSNNAVIIDRCISKEYKLCSSAIAFRKSFDRDSGKKKNKLFLLLCVDIPQQQVKLNPKKALFAYLGIDKPIQCLFKQATDPTDVKLKWVSIGNEDEFIHRRLQIQAALRRCQINCRYSKGGKGRKRKMKAVEWFHEKEKNYVDTKLHLYSRLLVDLAIKNRCSTIFLVNQKPREKKAKDEKDKGKDFLLRNWSYFGLKTKIDYKCKKVGIQLLELGNEDNSEVKLDED